MRNKFKLAFLFICGFMIGIHYSSGSKILFWFFIILAAFASIIFIIDDIGIENINNKIMQNKNNKGKRKMILKAKCPRCNSVCTCEYNGDKSEDDLYYSNEPFRFECNNRGCRPSYQFGGSYSFVVPAKDIEFVKEKER